jgi:hypothetical protein
VSRFSARASAIPDVLVPLSHFQSLRRHSSATFSIKADRTVIQVLLLAMGKDYYKILDIPKSASDDEIKKGETTVWMEGNEALTYSSCSIQETGIEMAS